MPLRAKRNSNNPHRLSTTRADSTHMPPGTEVAAAYGRVTNDGDQTVVITAISSSVGEVAQIHDVIADGDQRRMVQLDAVSLAAGESTEFKPGGQHIMLLGVTAPPPEGSQVELLAHSQ